MDLSNDLISKFVKITNDDKNKNGESTVYGTVVEYNGGMYVRIDGSDLLTPVETTADFKPNERVTVMIKNHSATVTGNITSPATNEGAVTEKVTEAVEEVEGKVITEVEILIADRVSTKQLDAEVARIDELIAGKASVEDLTATNAEITNLKADKASIKDLTATNAEITNLKAEDAKIENLLAGKATVEDLTATNAEITNLKAKDAEIENLVADKARIEDLTATNARIDSLQANKADITYLDANFATIDELEAAHADIEILDAEVANINTLVNGNLTSDNILSLNITSQNTTMENAFVKDAMIDTVTANKIMSGTIDTNNVTIQSTDGSMLLQGTLLQMKDDNGKVRIQIGKDTGGNFTFILYDESGTGVLIDEEGIKSSDAIADGLIVDAKVADNANIAGSKLDIASVITEVNNDNSTTIKSNKIYLDEQGQSLEVAFNSLKTQVETIQDVTIDGDLTAVIEQVQSNTTQIAANKEGISTLVSENTIRKEEIQNLDGEIESVNNTLSSKYSSLEQDVSGFKTTVADTYTTKSEFNNLQIGGKNLLLDSKREITNNEYLIGSFRPTELFEVGEQYTVSICVTPANGVDSIKPFISGGYMGLSNPIYVNGATKQVISITFTFNGYASDRVPVDITDSNADVQFYRLPNDGAVTGNTTLHWVKIEKGAKATDWSPAPEDVQGQIDATNNNLATNYSTTSAMNSAINQKANEITSSVSQTYATKQSVTDVSNNLATNYSTTSQMNSAIQQKANEITSSVSETYTTKSEFNNLQIGGTNLIQNGNFKGAIAGSTSMPNPWTFWSDEINIYWSNGLPGYNHDGCVYIGCNLTDGRQAGIYSNDIHVSKVEKGATYMASFIFAIENNVKGATAQLEYLNDARDQILHTQILTTARVESNIINGLHEHQYHIPFTMWTGDFSYMRIVFNHGGTNIPSNGYLMIVGNVQIEKGNKATDWSPAPEDVQGQIDATNNNLANNYSTTSQMNSAIQQKANEITSSVSQTYTTKSEFNNLQIGGKNLLLNSKRETTNNSYCIDEFRPTELFEVGEKYTVSICVTPANGVDYILPFISGGYNTLSNGLVVNGVTKQVISITFTFNGYASDRVPVDITDSNAFVQFYRFPNDGTVTSNTTLHWVKVEKGAKATDWSPAPEDVQGQIDATNNNLANNYSTTSAMNSAIQQKANEITSSVSQTYTTKAEFNNLEVGGTNLIYNGGFNRNLDRWNVNGGSCGVHACTESPSGYMLRMDVTNYGHGAYQIIAFHDSTYCTDYVVSFYAKANVDGLQMYASMEWDPATNTVFTLNGGWQKCVYKFRRSNPGSNALVFYSNGIGTGSIDIHSIKMEKGTVPSAWSPHPSEIENKVDNLSNNLATNYSTTSAMNSAIQQKANEITSSVSETYATKQSVTDINNNLANNYSTTSQMNSAIQQKANEITSTVSQTYISNYEAKKLADTTTTGLNKYLFERYQRDGFNYGARPTLNDLVGARLIESQLVDNPPAHMSNLGDNYIGVLTFYLYYDHACTKTVTITTDDHGTVYLNNVGIYELTTCQPANVTFNMIKGLNRIDIIYAEGGGGDGVSWGGVDGWSAFGAYANVVTNEIANRTNELTLAMTQGNMLYTDPTFRNGNNGIEIYNNSLNGNVLRERIAAIEGCPNTSGYCLKITTNGEASPVLGGFTFRTYCRYNAVFITKITAKIPVGYRIVWASNYYGDNGKQKWLSSTEGTGDWYDYYCKVKCGDYGHISDTNYFYLDGPLATAENPVTWYVSYATVFDVTDSDERITNLTNNLSTNYSTTSQMNSAIQQKANEITSSVSQTYTTKSETTAIQNQITTSRNLLMGSRDYNLGKWSPEGAAVQYEWYNGTRIYTTTIAWASMDYWVSDLIDRGVIELFTPYTFSCYVMSTSSDYTPNIHFYGDGLPNFNGAYCGTASTSWQRISITLEWSSFDNRSYPIRFEATTDSPNSSTSYLRWACFQLERGRVATGWAPAPEDAQYGINEVNDNLANNYSTTSAMNSAIQQKANEITSSVSETYTTKSEFNSLNIGSTNLVAGTKDFSGWGYYNLYMNKINETAIDSRFTGMSVSFTLSASDDYCDLGKYEAVWVEPDTEYTLSFWARGSGQFYTYLYTHDGGPVASHYNSSGYSGTQVDGASIHTLSSNDTYKRYWVVYRTSSTAKGIVSLIATRAAKNLNTDVNMVIYGVKFEKGNRPTDWSPAPEDVQGQIDATNNNLANNYSTTSAMNSAIQQKANEITSSVSQTYATKQSVTDVNNNLANNYSTTSQMNSAIQQKANEITSSVSQTYITKSETSLINDTVAGNRKWLFEMYTNNQYVGTGGGTYPTLAHLANETLISSRLVDSLPGYTSAIGDFYIGVYTVYLYYESAYTWSGSIISDDESTTYLNGVAVCQATSCTDTPFTMNFKKGINKLQIIHGEGGGGDGVTLSDLGPWKEYGAYPACVTAASSNHYASNSDIVQTANDLTIKFTESGGYNLLQNGHADKGTSYWRDNGGGITTHANAGGSATGNFFGTSFPHGISYYDWVKLLPNTHYVYQAKIWSNAAFSGNSAVPLHFWFSYDTVNNTGDGYTILDYQQNVSYTGTWTQCYVHFVTGNNDIYIRPFIYTGGASTDIFVTELMLSQSRVVQPWSPHPSEVYSGITQVDKDGIRVHHSNANSYTHMAPDGFFVNNNGTDVVQVTASGLYVQGNITSGSTIQGARITGSTFNSSNDVFQVLEDGTIETSFLAVNGAVSTDKLNVNDIENASYPKVLSEATTVYISPNGGVNAEEFYDGAYFTSLSNMLAVAPRNLNGYTLTIRMAGDLYENAALTWFHSGQVNFEMQGYTLYGYFYGYGASMCYRLYGNTNANNSGAWGHIKPNTGRALGSYSYAVQFQYCQFAINNIAVYPSASSGSSSGGISAHRGATGIVFSAKACGDMRYLVRAEYAGRVHVNSTEGACNNATFCATTGAIITLNSSNDQAGRTTTGNPYWVGTGGIIAADQLLGMDKIKFKNSAQSGSSSSSGSTTRKVTETVKATSADTYRSTVYNNWKGDGTVRQGDYGYGDCQGCWFFGNNLYNTMNAGTVTKVVIRIKRQSGGVNALQTLTVKSHNHTSRPSGAPTYTNTIGTCSCAVGSYIDLVITDQTTINKLKNCKGLGLSIGSASSPYAVCSGACSVIITYTTNN